MTERPEDDLSFASPGPVTPAAGPDGTPPVAGTPPAAGTPGATAAGPTGASVPAPPGRSGDGTRWGAPGGPTPAERAAARRTARIWVLSVVGLIVLVVAGATGISALTSSAREQAWEPVAADVTAPTTVNAVQLVLGSCLSGASTEGGVGEVEVVPCADPHVAEVVGRTDAASDAIWPGEDVVAARTARGCTAGLLGPQARAEAERSVTFVVWTPTEDAWEAGDRTGLCVAVLDDERTGSLLD
ncbi:septum formation family protein [Isoptericola sp. AK164]|uniref:septum formation family protein n=1 Tax=Isoptericola sp. AK164 TaxID=3024246 RepID=UPI002418ACEF|nr:septum formation family protein [Isoptericola sp. AK164]